MSDQENERAIVFPSSKVRGFDVVGHAERRTVLRRLSQTDLMSLAARLMRGFADAETDDILEPWGGAQNDLHDVAGELERRADDA